MSRDVNGIYSAPSGTAAIGGAYITDAEWNNFVTDVGVELTGSARESELRDVGGASTTTGTGAAYALQLQTPWGAVPSNTPFSFRAHTANTGAVTIALNGSTVAYPLRAISGVDLAAGDITTGAVYASVFSPTSFALTFTGNLTNNSNQVTGASTVKGLAVGQSFASITAGVPAGTTITGVSGSTVTLSAPFTGQTTPSATCAATGGEVLLLNGGALLTASKLATTGGVTINSISSSTTLTGAFSSKFNLVTGSPTLTFDLTANLKASWATYLTNAGTGDVTLQATPTSSFTGSVQQGSTSIVNVSSTSGLAVGQLLTGPAVAATSFSGSWINLNGQGYITGITTSVASLQAGAALFPGTMAIPAGALAVSIGLGATVTGTIGSGPTVTGVSSTAQLALGQQLTASGNGGVGSYIVGINGTTVTLSQSVPNGAASSSLTFSPVIATSAVPTVAATPGTFSVGGGFPSGTQITAINSTTAITVSSAWAGTNTVTAALTAYSDRIDGLPGYILYPGEIRLFTCDGTKLASSLLTGGSKVFTASGAFIVPPGVSGLRVRCIGAGGGGAGGSSFGAAGGGGGAFEEGFYTGFTAGQSIPAIVGAGGTGNIANFAGTAGGATSFGGFLRAAAGAGGTLGTNGSTGPAAAAGGISTTLGVYGNGGNGTGAPSNSAPSAGGDAYLGGAGGGGSGGNGNATPPPFIGGSGGGRGFLISSGGTGSGVVWAFTTSTAQSPSGLDAIDGYGAGGGCGGVTVTASSGARGGNGGNPGGGGGAGGMTAPGGIGGRGEIRIMWN